MPDDRDRQRLGECLGGRDPDPHPGEQARAQTHRHAADVPVAEPDLVEAEADRGQEELVVAGAARDQGARHDALLGADRNARLWSRGLDARGRASALLPTAGVVLYRRATYGSSVTANPVPRPAPARRRSSSVSAVSRIAWTLRTHSGPCGGRHEAIVVVLDLPSDRRNSISR